jgi:hypothetical protein
METLNKLAEEGLLPLHPLYYLLSHVTTPLCSDAIGKLKPLIDSEHAFEDVLRAYERIMSNRARGKVIVNVSTD